MTDATSADDLRARIATSLQFSFVGAEMDRRDVDHVEVTVHDTEKAADRLIAAVVEPELARLRDEATAAHTRNAVLRSEHRTEVEQLRAEIYDRPTRWAYEAACEALEKRRVALVEALGLPDGEGFYEAVKKVAALRPAVSRLSGGNTPADAEERVERAAKYLLSLQQAGGVSPDELGQFWANVTDSRRELWRGRARVLGGMLAGPGWGSAVATPADTQAAVSADTKYLCPTHWASYLEGHSYWDEACENCDHIRARRILGPEAPPYGKRTVMVDPRAGTLAVARHPEGPVRHQYRITPVPAASSGGAEDTEAREDAEDELHHATFKPKLARPVTEA